MEVQSPVGTTIGYVCQTWSPCYPKFAIKDAKENVVLRIEGPLCTCNCCGDVEFDVSNNGLCDSLTYNTLSASLTSTK